MRARDAATLEGLHAYLPSAGREWFAIAWRDDPEVYVTDEGPLFVTPVRSRPRGLPLRPTMTRSSRALACAAALLTLAACGGDADGEKTSASSRSTSEPTYDDEYVLAEAKGVAGKQRAHDPNKPLPESTEWATASYVKAYNDELEKLKKANVTRKGEVRVTATHLQESSSDAAGGWDLTVVQCSSSTSRLYRGGKDVTGTPGDPSTPLPKGPHQNVHLMSFTTSDDGKTWRLDKVQQLLGKDARESPCQSN